jgi:SsrA-binding protein
LTYRETLGKQGAHPVPTPNGPMAASPTKLDRKADRLIARNKRARFEYELGETYEAGMVLIGSEVRSLREHPADLSDAWVDVDSKHEAWVKELRIPRLKHAAFGHDERRPRKLLLHATEIAELEAGVAREGMTIVATECYFKQGKIKLRVALGRGKRLHDKRQALRAREAEREARAAVRRASRA